MDRRTLVRAVIVCALIAIPLTIFLAPSVAAFVYEVIAFLAPLWLPLLLVTFGWRVWLTFVRSQFVSSVPYSLIELKPGAETPKSAHAMELVYYALYHRSEVSWFQEYILGHVHMPWSFELASNAGRIRFFVYLPDAHRAAVEARIRAEYPDIDIDDVRDYSRLVHFDPFSMRLAMREYALLKPDPYPLRTYAESESASTMSAFHRLLENVVQVNEHEHLFISLIVRPHQREWSSPFKNPTDLLHEAAEIEIRKIVGAKGDMRGLSKNIQALVHAIESGLNKPSFDCGIRALYVADRRHYDESRASALNDLFDPFGDAELNAFGAYDPRERVGWPLTEVFAVAPVLAMNYCLNLYRRRAYFAPPYYGKVFVLNTEELATIFHIPHIQRASALAKMRGVTLEPPDNLPV